VKNIQDLIIHIRTALNPIYAKPEADAMAMQIAEHVLQLTRLQLSVQRQSMVREQTWTEVESIIQRLQQHEPLQYVLGCTHFYGLVLEVSPAVLIPRPETEELVDLIVQENGRKQNLRILDICTGSGCIPVALAAHLHSQAVYGLDVSAPALAVARRNAANYKQNITWLEADIMADIINLPPEKFDIIVSNPPYVLQKEKEQMRANVVNYEPHLALFVPNSDALRFYKQIARLGLTYLQENGILYFEINENQGTNLVQVLRKIGYGQVKVLKDLFGKDRFLRATLNSI
jgi:release factor glutamine methyltransferase